ncbi:MAG TPA: hypothetical protein VF976_13785 [Gemmatimonadales bacterium]
MRELGSTLGALERATQSDGDPTRALHDAVAAIGRIAERAAGDGPLDGLRRRQLVSRGARILSGIIRRGVESGTFQPPCPRWAVESLPRAVVAGVCARWVFDLREERSLWAGAAADAALDVLRPRVPVMR